MKERAASVDNYQCVYHSYAATEKDETDLVFLYRFRKPKKIRMEIIEGPHADTILIYNSEHYQNQVRVRAGNALIAYLQKLLSLEYLDVQDRWVTDVRGNSILESDWNWFIDQHLYFIHLNVVRTESVETENLVGRPVLHYILTSANPDVTSGIAKEEIWVDIETVFPIKYVQYDTTGRAVRRSTFSNVRLNAEPSPDLFIDF